jgi:hypothetical protein
VCITASNDLADCTSSFQNWAANTDFIATWSSSPPAPLSLSRRFLFPLSTTTANQTSSKIETSSLHQYSKDSLLVLILLLVVCECLLPVWGLRHDFRRGVSGRPERERKRERYEETRTDLIEWQRSEHAANFETYLHTRTFG